MRSRRLLLVVALVASLALPASAQSLIELVERATPSVAFLIVQSPIGKTGGSAFVVSPDGLLVTAGHVVSQATEIAVWLPGRQPLRATVANANYDADVAVIRVTMIGSSPLTPLPLGEGVRLAEEVLVLGYPMVDSLGATGITVTRGIVSALRNQQGLIQVDAAMNPGVSGGPVINLKGEVIGVAVARLNNAQGINFAVPIASAKALLGRPAAASPPATGQPPAGSAPPAGSPPPSGGAQPPQPARPAVDTSLVPGDRVGRLRLGMSAADAATAMGWNPDESVKAGGGTMLRWYLNPGAYQAVSGQPKISAFVDDASHRVTQITVNVRQFKTPGGNGAGDAAEAFAREFGQPAFVQRDGEGQESWQFRGVAIWFSSATRVVTSVAVLPP